MVKRRRLKDDGEDGEDEDYQPDEEELRAAHRARFNRNGPRTRGRQAAQMETAGQAETGDVDADATGANNTSEVQHQPTANAPQVPDDSADDPAKASRVRKTGKTMYCGKIVPRTGKAPKKAKRTEGDYFCIICGSSFTRAEGVNYHFVKCVETYGNPHGYNWNSHPSCSQKTTRKHSPAASTSSDVEPPASKKPRTKDVTSVSQPEPRITRSNATQKTLKSEPDSGNRLTKPFTISTKTTKTDTKLAEKPATKSASLTKPFTISTKTTKTDKKLAENPATKSASMSLTQSKVDTKQASSKQSRKPRSKAVVKAVGTRGEKTVDQSLSPLSDLGAMFNDLVSNGREKIGLLKALQHLSDKQINIATMCSGTESPLLALEKIQNGLRASGLPLLNMKHMFSAEIDALKQAYIQRNFHPDILFRDIREMAAGGQATTAYGALTPIPSNVDLLVAGFSCVDFSNLNKKRKGITDIGESGDTFRAILEYAKRYRPSMILLENVDGAPWDLIEAVWKNDREFIRKYFKKFKDASPKGLDIFWEENDVAYAAAHHRVDAKQYYIPQTRTRRYMLCLDRRQFSPPSLADEAVAQWTRNMKALERRASVSVEAFLLSGDDVRLQYAKDQLSKTGKPRRETDWEACYARHEKYRAGRELGVSRPILEWTNDGSAKASGYFWVDWTLSQVERIWDSIEICYLRNAAKGFDSFYKPRFWELSQNIDRFMDDTPSGIIGCLTPTGQPFSSIRGGPVIGLEALALQGLPIDTLSLTRETERQLSGLAGNAMTSTVVGAALLAGLCVGHEIFKRANESAMQPVQDTGFDMKNMRKDELLPKQLLSFDGSGESSLEELCTMAKASVRLCHCEAQTYTTRSLMRICKCCHHHCCEKCGNLPKHEYELLGGNGIPLRTEPKEFRKLVRHAIPTRLLIEGFSSEQLEDLAELHPERPEQDWKIFSEAILLAMKQEYRYESTERSHCWRVIYTAASSRLELVFARDSLHWLVYGKPDQKEAGNSPVRRVLNEPLARLTVLGRTMTGEYVREKTLIEGCWEVHLPVPHIFPITIIPQGEWTDSWEKKLGLQGKKFIDRQVNTSLQIARTPDPAAGILLDQEICGDYDLLENCGTACSSLHKKRPGMDDRDAPPLFLFLDPARLGLPDHDCYVFSTETQRLEYGENRYIVAKVESKWRPPHKDTHQKADLTASSEAECTVSGRWAPCPLSLRPHQAREQSSFKFTKDVLFMPIFGNRKLQSQYSTDDTYGCLHDTAITALLTCEIPGQLVDSVGWQVGRWTIMDQKSERQVAAAFAWLFARVEHLADVNDSWRPLGPRPWSYRKCLACAPDPPKIMWARSTSGKKTRILPCEDGNEARQFEQKTKARPPPFLVQTYVGDDENHTGQLEVGLNLSTLVHRALASLGNIADRDEINMVWRLDTRYEAPTRYKLNEFTLTNNKLHIEAQYAFPTGERLRPEQKRSLQWMIEQEADRVMFYEEEIEEAVLPQLSWRAEVRVRRNRVLRGGILADEVGYGKTATTLALIGAQEEKAKSYAKEKKHGSISTLTNQDPGSIKLQATLILVPYHLVHQWKGQALKFLGIASNDDKLLVIKDVSQLGKTSVEQMKKALIIIASWKVLRSPSYMANLSHFAALPEGPSSGQRETKAWLTRACENIRKHMGELISEHSCPKDFAENILKKRFKEAYEDGSILRTVPTKRLKGAKYTAWNKAEPVTPEKPSILDKDLERYFKPMTRKECKDLDSMTGILFHMFDFYRIVVDEYTYVDEGQRAEKVSNFITTLNARSRWVLSGTPNLQDFGDVQHLASLLAYNLGVVDDAAGVLRGSTIKNIRGARTDAEQFRAFGYSHTAAWHMGRQAHAQKFLDKYASKNVAEIGMIKSELQLRPHLLGAAETILNAELQQQLQATDMRIVLRGKSRRDNDRLRRYNDLLKDCKTAVQCLLKALAYFELEETRAIEHAVLEDAMDLDDDAPDSLFGACQTLITIRERQMSALVEELEYELLHAAWLGQQCARATESELRGTHYREWKSTMKRTGLRDPEATSDIRRYLEEALGNLDDDTEEIYYRDLPTQEELDKEKAAATKRKKAEKAKRTADRRAAKASGDPRKRKASKKTKEDSEESSGSDNEDNQADDVEPNPREEDDEDEDPDPPDSKPNKIDRDDFEKFASVSREITGHLRSLVSEFTSRTRSLRFARGAQELCLWSKDLGGLPQCASCGRFVRHKDSISINIRCGHLTCKYCIQETGLSICAVDGCGEGTESYRMKKAADLVGAGPTPRNGSRMGNIVELIKSLPKDEQVLLFIQFDDLMLKTAMGLEAAGISNHALHKKAGPQLVHMMNDFQDNQGDDKKKVMLLNPGDETASGINLTNANHVIFVSPLLTDTQQSYNASMTQCIGRARRYGQQNTVHVYRFVALRTVDVDILQEREEKTLVKKKSVQEGEEKTTVVEKNLEKGKAAGWSGVGAVGAEAVGEWLLVEKDAIDDSLEAGWGSGYDFKSDPMAEED